MEIVVGITGATGSIYAVRLLEALKENGVYTHLIMSHWAKENTVVEAKYSLDYLEGLAGEVHDNKNLGARTSSGSYVTDADYEPLGQGKHCCGSQIFSRLPGRFGGRSA